MADKQLKSIMFPGLQDKYIVPQGGANIPPTTNLLKGDGNGEAIAAQPDVDYATIAYVDSHSGGGGGSGSCVYCDNQDVMFEALIASNVIAPYSVDGDMMLTSENNEIYII